MKNERNLFGWFSGEKKFTVQEVKQLLESVKEFNCGAIDQHLTKHVDTAFANWLTQHNVTDGGK